MQITQPNPTWDEKSYEETVDAFSALDEDTTVRVWGADWCGDCRAELPDFFAALEASDLPESAIEVYEVDREKNGELTDEYDVTLIPTVVVERDSEELARFEESATRPAAQAVADQLHDR